MIRRFRRRSRARPQNSAGIARPAGGTPAIARFRAGVKMRVCGRRRQPGRMRPEAALAPPFRSEKQMTMTPLTPEALTALIGGSLEAGGLCAPQAEALARILAACERDGCKSHGVYRVEGCLRTLKAGKVDRKALPDLSTDETAIVRVDARGGFSSLAFETALPALVERCRRHGLAAMVVTNCTHFTALWPEIEALAAENLAGMAMCPSYAVVAPAGGTRPLLGTNPLAFGWPRPGRPPYVFDIATSVAARGEIELHRLAGTPLPEGWALDASGAPTTDPEAALQGAMLPFGAHKGSAIATMIELLAGAMIGDLTSAEALDWLGTAALAPRHGELVLAFDPVRFAGAARPSPFARAETLFEAIAGQGARLPSERRFAARARSEAEGIALAAEEIDRLADFRRHGLDAVR
jgi:delta1-piperideine-2-carboxylate reductase